MDDDFEQARELFASFAKDNSLADLDDALAIVVDIVSDSDSDDKNKKKAENLFKTIRRSQIDDAKIILNKEENNPEKIKSCWKALNIVSMAGLQNNDQEEAEFNKIKNDLVLKEHRCYVEGMDERYIFFKKNSPPAVDFDSYLVGLAKRLEKNVPEEV